MRARKFHGEDIHYPYNNQDSVQATEYVHFEKLLRVSENMGGQDKGGSKEKNITSLLEVFVVSSPVPMTTNPATKLPTTKHKSHHELVQPETGFLHFFGLVGTTGQVAY